MKVAHKHLRSLLSSVAGSPGNPYICSTASARPQLRRVRLRVVSDFPRTNQRWGSFAPMPMNPKSRAARERQCTVT